MENDTNRQEVTFFKEHVFEEFLRYTGQQKYIMKTYSTALVCLQSQKKSKSDDGDELVTHLEEMEITTQKSCFVKKYLLLSL